MNNNFYITVKNERINRYDGADNKRTIIDEIGKVYLLKLPSIAKNNKEASYSNNIFSEYIGCHIFEILGIKAQETYLGTFENSNGIKKYACACTDFTDKEWKLVEFQKLRNSYEDISSTSNGGSTNLEDIEIVLKNHNQIHNKEKVQEHFWNMFVVDALIGNFDRHNGNWGLLVNENTNELKIAPVYDCGSCLFSQLTDEQMGDIVRNQNEIDKRVYERPLSTLQIKNKKINYSKFIASQEKIDCNEAIKRIVPKIDIQKINNIIDETPFITDIRREFYKVIIKNRFEKMLLPVYERLKNG